MKLICLGMLALAVGCAAPQEYEGRMTPFRDKLFQERALKDLTLDGRSYCYLDMGQGPPLVLLHGLGGSLYDWRHLIRSLATTRRVIAFDLLGSGESDIPEYVDLSVAAQARRMKGLLDHLGVDHATLVGNSYGGGIALRFAQDWPGRVERLVLLNSICYADRIPTYVYVARAPFAGCIAEAVPLGSVTRSLIGDPDGVLEALTEAELDTYTREFRRPGRRRAMIDALRTLIPPDPTEFEARLKHIDVPALLIWGVKDTSVPLELGYRLQRDLPNARLIEVQAGHVPNQECPDDVLKLIREFLP